MSHVLHIVIAQINPFAGDIEYNLDKIKKAWDSASTAADLIVFPELTVTGYSAGDLFLKPVFLDAAERAVKSLVKESKNRKPWIVVGAPLRSRGKIYNVAHLIGDGKIQATVKKHRLPNYAMFDEPRWFTAAPLPSPVTFRGHKIGLVICEDLWQPGPAAALKKKGAELIISINSSPYDFSKHEQRLAKMRLRTAESGLPLIYVNQCGGHDGLVFEGSSFAMNESGQVIMRAPEFTECLYHTAWEKSAHGHWLCSTNEIAPNLEKNEAIYTALKTGLRDYVTRNGFSGVLLGLSGGIDSALVATLAVDTLGHENVRAVFMPSKYTSTESEDDARAIAKSLNIHLDTISIADQVAAFEKELLPHFTAQTPEITFQNIQSRCRGVVLMALSNAMGKIVLATGNKSEIAVGYATLYGDMCGGYCPLKDVYKMQVYELARWRNGKNPVISERVLTKAPTAELKHGQTDQDTLPPYAVLDAILECLIEQDMGIKDTVAQGYDNATVLSVWKMLDRSDYKRQQGAPGPQISPRAFAHNRRYPITNGFTKIIEK